ncbi:hypothetical protein Btru_031540 [Bulinus truncatus]|nr:hypothetical protein Btru_031540 [Bulinus truncatus]
MAVQWPALDPMERGDEVFNGEVPLCDELTAWWALSTEVSGVSKDKRVCVQAVSELHHPCQAESRDSTRATRYLPIRGVKEKLGEGNDRMGGESEKGKGEGPVSGYYRGPVGGHFMGPVGGYFRGPVGGYYRGPFDGYFRGPVGGHSRGPVGGYFQGPRIRWLLGILSPYRSLAPAMCSVIERVIADIVPPPPPQPHLHNLLHKL